MVLHFLAGQVLALALDDAAVLARIAQLAFVAQVQAMAGGIVLHPVGQGGHRRLLDVHRAHRQRAQHLAQGGEQILGAPGAGAVHQDQALFGGDGGEGLGLADEGTRQEGLHDLVLQLLALLLVHLAHLLGFDLLDLLLQRIAHHAARQDAFFLACRHQIEPLADMGQRRIRAVAAGRDEAVGGQFLAGAGASGLFGQCGFQGLGIEAVIRGQTINEQVAEPHGGGSLLKAQRDALFPLRRKQANPEGRECRCNRMKSLSLWNISKKLSEGGLPSAGGLSRMRPTSRANG